MFAILLQFITLYIDEQLTCLLVSGKGTINKPFVCFKFLVDTQLTVNRTLRLAKKKLVSESSIRFGYFFYGCIVFVFLPSYLFKLAEHGWTYLDAVYFSVISLTKIGFGDYVPSKFSLSHKIDRFRYNTSGFLCSNLDELFILSDSTYCSHSSRRP